MEDTVSNGQPYFLYYAITVPNGPNTFDAFDFSLTATPAGDLDTAPNSGMVRTRAELRTRADGSDYNPGDYNAGLMMLWSRF